MTAARKTAAVLEFRRPARGLPVRVPPRLDLVVYPGGHVWRRYPHEAVVLKAKAAICQGEEVTL